jgi:signal transduction histidine kinase
MATRNSALSQNTTDDRWLRLGHVLWYPSAAIALCIFIASIPGYMVMLQEGGPGFDLVAHPSSLKIALNTANVAVSISAAFLSLILAWVLYRKKSGERMVVFLSFFLLLFGVGIGPLETLAQMWLEYPEFGSPIIVSLLLAPPFIALLFVFPDGRFVPSWTRWIVIFSIPIILIGFTLEASIESSLSSPMGIGSLWSFAVGLTALFAQLYRYRRVSNPDERQQTKWVVYGLSLMFLFMGVSSVPYAKMLLLTPGSPFPWWVPVAVLVYTISLTFLPLSLTVAVLRFRLYDIDFLINRTLVYGVLTAIVVVFYMLVVGAVSLGFQTNNKLAGTLLATILVGVLFKPLRAILQRSVDRLMYPRGGGIHQHASMERSDDLKTLEEVTTSTSLTEGWFRIIRLIWFLVAILAIGVLFLSIPGYLMMSSEGPPDWERYIVEITPQVIVYFSLYSLFSLAAAALSVVLGLVLFLKKSNDRMAVFLSFYLLVYGIGLSGPVEMLVYFWPNLSANGFVLLSGIVMGPLTASFFAMFPDGKIELSWTRWLVFLSTFILPLNYLVHISFQTFSENPLVWIMGLAASASLLTTFFILLSRYRKVFTPIQQQQTKWVIYGFAAFIVFQAITGLPFVFLKSLPNGSPLPWWFPFASLFWILSLTFIPISLTVSLMRYRLYDIDIIINRTLVYGVLTASTMGIYVIVVGYLGNVFQTQEKSIIAFLTTGLVALLFQPFRERLQRVVNRLMYGERDDPMALLLKLGKQLEQTGSPQAALAGIVETVAQVLKLPYVAISLLSKGEYKVLEECGQPIAEPIQLPLLFQTDTVGQLIVSPRSPGESFNAEEMDLLRNISLQFGAAAHSVRLSVDLQRSRERLAVTLEEERRRLRRDLHDGLGASLAALHLEMGGLRRMIRGNPEMAEEMVDAFRTELREGINDIRRVVYQLRPPALDELGLVAALRAQADRLNEQTGLDQKPGGDQNMAATLEIRVDAPDMIPPLPAAVEVAVFRIVQEALTNVVQHSMARICVVQLALEDELNLKISDDGIGIGEVQKTGIGLHSMRERAEELGGKFVIGPNPQGGTLVWVRLPILKE